MKKCSKCNIEKELIEFYKRKDSKDGHRNECKNCKNEISKKYTIDNYEKVSNIKKKYYLLNKDEVIKRSKNWNLENSEKHKETCKRYREREEVKDRFKKLYLENKEYYSKKNKEYKLNNKDKINKKHRENYKKDNLYRLKFMIRNIISKSIKRNGYRRSSRTENILGCSFEDFKLYIESKFENWMSWDNYGLYNGELNHGWDIDHIIPISSSKTEEDMIRLNHYINLQPLCSKINRDIKRNLL